MNFVADIADDCSLFDGARSVTLRQVRPEGSADRAVAHALPAALTRDARVATGVSVMGDERTWQLSAAEVGAGGVEPGDLIIDQTGAAWSVVSARLLALETRWCCVCRRQHEQS
jgi:hypothetical protein